MAFSNNLLISKVKSYAGRKVFYLTIHTGRRIMGFTRFFSFISIIATAGFFSCDGTMVENSDQRGEGLRLQDSSQRSSPSRDSANSSQSLDPEKFTATAEGKAAHPSEVAGVNLSSPLSCVFKEKILNTLTGVDNARVLCSLLSKDSAEMNLSQVATKIEGRQFRVPFDVVGRDNDKVNFSIEIPFEGLRDFQRIDVRGKRGTNDDTAFQRSKPLPHFFPSKLRMKSCRATDGESCDFETLTGKKIYQFELSRGVGSFPIQITSIASRVTSVAILNKGSCVSEGASTCDMMDPNSKCGVGNLPVQKTFSSASCTFFAEVTRNTKRVRGGGTVTSPPPSLVVNYKDYRNQVKALNVTYNSSTKEYISHD